MIAVLFYLDLHECRNPKTNGQVLSLNVCRLCTTTKKSTQKIGIILLSVANIFYVLRRNSTNQPGLIGIRVNVSDFTKLEVLIVV